jgi:hypothetical protein
VQANDAIMTFPRRTRSELSRMSVTELKDLLQSLLMAVDKANDVLISALEERERAADLRRPSVQQALASQTETEADGQ